MVTCAFLFFMNLATIHSAMKKQVQIQILDVNLHICITPSQPDVTLILPKFITSVKTPQQSTLIL